MILELLPVFEGCPEKPVVSRGKEIPSVSVNLCATGVGSSVHITGRSCLINSKSVSRSVLGQIKLNLPNSVLLAVGSRLKQH